MIIPSTAKGVARYGSLAFVAAAIVVLAGAITLFPGERVQAQAIAATPASVDLDISEASVTYRSDLDLLVFEQQVAGTAGATVPTAAGQLDGAPVLGYVFPTTLTPSDVGFGDIEGIVALAATSHPDFDDTPLWDENGDGDLENDGRIYHSHWVVLAPDDRATGGLAVKQFDPDDKSVVMPPTNPGMPMYLDSPGFPVRLEGDRLRVIVPVERVGGKTGFNYDAVTAYMQVNTSGSDRPLLGVYEAYSVRSGDLSLPYAVEG